MDKITFSISDDFANQRIDTFLSNHKNSFSRSYIKKLITSGNVTINGNRVKASYNIQSGDSIILTVPDPVRVEIIPENITLDVKYEDDDLLVVNKPQGMVVHPAVGNYSGTLVNALMNHCKYLSGINGEMRPGIVHRIDKDTSGLLMIAKSDRAHKSLSEQLKEHTITRRYIALTEGIIENDSGKIVAPIGRHPKDRKKMAVVEKNSKNAITHFKVINRYNSYTLIEARLETGRTHQIRVHMQYIAHPVVGDQTYGYRKNKFNLKGQLLHAYKLGFIHPASNEAMEFTVDIPDYFEKILKHLGQEIMKSRNQENKKS